MKIKEDASLKLVVLLIAIVASVVYRPFILMDAWRWFVVPEFGVSELDWTNAFCLSLAALLYLSIPQEKDQTLSATFGGMLLSMPGLHLLLWWWS